MEILLAVLIFSIVLAAIQSVFFAALKLRNSTTASVESSVPLEHTLDVVKRDLANLVLPGPVATGTVFLGPLQSSPTTSANTPGGSGGFGTLGGGSQFGSFNAMGSGLGSGPVFYTAVGAINQWTPFADVEKVTYYLAPPTNNSPGMDLVRVVERNLLPVAQEEYAEQFLMSGVQEIAFQYYDGIQWLDYWDSTLVGDPSTTITNPLPRAIKFQLQLAEAGTTRSTLAPVELIVPLCLQSLTNQTASTTDTTGGGL